MGATSRRTADKTELRKQPAYGLTEAARYLKLPAPTLRSWVAGRDYPKAKGVGHFRPLIHTPRTDPPVLPPLEYNPQAAKLARQRTMEFFDQRLRK